MDPDKKLKLDDLPDEGSSSLIAHTKVPSKPKQKIEKDPRLERLKELDDSKKVHEMQTTWHFDRSEWQWGWLVYLLLLMAFQSLDIGPRIAKEFLKLDENSLGFGSVFTDLIHSDIAYIINHPVLFLILMPLFFKFKASSLYYFDIKFDGISTVDKIEKKGDLPHRVFIKWGDIKSVTKLIGTKREVLAINGTNEKLGELIWDIEEKKKKAFGLLIKGLVPPSHALRDFLEKELK